MTARTWWVVLIESAVRTEAGEFETATASRLHDTRKTAKQALIDAKAEVAAHPNKYQHVHGFAIGKVVKETGDG
ncbi:hypothetical protein [Nocardia brasiliensis]|uniref:hypothetical protein n=1 Tax=Nocardia brasiliensis TaxID=37326 RepID=UPI002458F2EC|nr:hypothetical protein [Nocardia brasiliensis]